ncbi:hypothetical protein SASPL_152470 [Salvia splendens]|uniref:Uncharacterized protein n=1 Tax=Salvia splendens TaxID=180675 RepID=A0A8X8Z0V7_SALSN|nr:hypothetical protein SASPL_152470 [Salvia splendens]
MFNEYCYIGFICRFIGVSCWNDRENRLISLELRDFALAGAIPASLQFCESFQTLDLSGDSISGPIPPEICRWLPYLTTLNLSRKALTGQILEDLANCSYLNTLILDDNKLSGSIPYKFSNLQRMKITNRTLNWRKKASLMVELDARDERIQVLERIVEELESEDLTEEEMQRCLDENERVIREIGGGRRWMVTTIATAAAVIFYVHAHRNHKFLLIRVSVLDNCC